MLFEVEQKQLGDVRLSFEIISQQFPRFTRICDKEMVEKFLPTPPETGRMPKHAGFVSKFPISISSQSQQILFSGL